MFFSTIFFFSFILFPFVWWYMPVWLGHSLPPPIVPLCDIIPHTAQPSSLRASSLPSPVYFHSHCHPSYAVLLSSHHIPIPPQPTFPGLPLRFSQLSLSSRFFHLCSLQHQQGELSRLNIPDVDNPSTLRRSFTSAPRYNLIHPAFMCVHLHAFVCVRACVFQHACVWVACLLQVCCEWPKCEYACNVVEHGGEQ